MRTLILVLLLVSTYAFAQDYPMGMNWDEQSYRSIPYKTQFTASTYDNLPSSYTLEQFTPTTGNQGQYGTCVAYAAAYGLQTTMLVKDLSLADKNKILYSSASPGFKVKEGASGYEVPLIVELTHL